MTPEQIAFLKRFYDAMQTCIAAGMSVQEAIPEARRMAEEAEEAEDNEEEDTE